MLTWIDIALLTILGLSAVVGVWRGLVSEVMALAVWIAAFWLAMAAGPSISTMFEPYVDAPTARWALGYAAVFIATLSVGGLATWLIGKLVKSTGLSGTDRILGLGFGLFRGLAVGSVLVLLGGFTPMPQEDAWRNSRLISTFESGAMWMKTCLPEAMAERVSFDPIPSLLSVPAFPSDNTPTDAHSKASMKTVPLVVPPATDDAGNS